MQQLAKKSINVHVTLASFSTGKVQLEVGITSRDLLNVFNRGRGQRCTPQIGVQNDSRCVDYRTQRVAQAVLQLPLDRLRQPSQSQVDRGRVQMLRGDFFAQAREHGPCSVSGCRVTFPFDQKTELWLV